MTDRVLIYVTTSGEEEAVRIARTLVEERLVACANVVPAVRSFYRWEGALQDDREAAFFAKTTRDRVDDVIRRVRELHSYQVPAILALPVLAGNAAYLAWVGDECAVAAAPGSKESADG
ncbi:MAG TPA: divalent-cation tolerance protein CutA [Bacillota bacterium]